MVSNFPWSCSALDWRNAVALKSPDAEAVVVDLPSRTPQLQRWLTDQTRSTTVLRSRISFGHRGVSASTEIPQRLGLAPTSKDKYGPRLSSGILVDTTMYEQRAGETTVVAGAL